MHIPRAPAWIYGGKMSFVEKVDCEGKNIWNLGHFKISDIQVNMTMDGDSGTLCS